MTGGTLAMPLYAIKTMKKKARGTTGDLQHITSGSYYSPKPSTTQPSEHLFRPKKSQKKRPLWPASNVFELDEIAEKNSSLLCLPGMLRLTETKCRVKFVIW
jgi:hypothetical protein